MKTSRAGIELIKRWEGCRLAAYKDSVGIWTIGYGHTTAAGEPKVIDGLKITQAEAESILASDLGKYESAVTKALTRTPTQPQFDAMVSLCYNIGPTAFSTSTLVRRFNGGDIVGTADAFLMWNKAGGKVLKGLEARRADERALFLKTQMTTVEPVGPTPAPSAPPAAETPPTAAPVAPDDASQIAKWLLAAGGALVAVLLGWMMKG